MLKQTIIILLLLLGFNTGAQQPIYTGTWQGIITKAGNTIENSTLFYLEINQNNQIISGFSREEVYGKDFFAVKHLKGEVKNNHLIVRQTVISKSKKSSRLKWCRLKMDLVYDSITGYLSGNFSSIDCKRVIGKIILYKSEFNLSKNSSPGTSQLWFSTMKYDLKEGLNAPEIRKKERDNFVFKPVYFDFDKAVIKPEYTDFLLDLIKVVKGHSDLRVKVIGHTDSEGSDQYNDDLSQRRAQAIIDFFVQNGLKPDRLVFDFKGEKMPVAPNNTKEGRQQNRRVDFSFI